MSKPGVLVEPMTSPTDFSRAFDIMYQCFAVQTSDGIFRALNPDYATPESHIRGAERLLKRWQSSTSRDKHGNPNTIFIKATVSTPESQDDRVVAGFAIWVQSSTSADYGEIPQDIDKSTNLEELYPGNPSEQQYLIHLDRSCHKQRNELIKDASSRSPPAIFALDLCCVHPDFQRRGVATKLVQWGLDEAKRRGGLEACMEASVMGRLVYVQSGFKQEGEQIVYHGAETADFARDGLPNNIFMRTGWTDC